jgi:hypothetical protein
MKSTIIRNGVWSSVFLIGVCAVPLLFLGLPSPDDFKRGEVIGYSSILLSMIFVVLGMKQYREENGGLISYWKIVKIGLMIALFPAIAFGLYNLLYMLVIDPEFLNKYAEYSLADRGAGKTAEEMVAIKQAVLAEQKMFENPVIQFVMMFLTVFIIGTIVSLVSGFFVRKGKMD